MGAGTVADRPADSHAGALLSTSTLLLAHAGHMPTPLARTLILFAVLVAAAACTNNTGQYQTPARGGWDNFRAETATREPLALARR